VLTSVLSGISDGAWNPDGVLQLITVDDVISETTLVSGVHAFPQATLLVKTKRGLEWNAYWKYNYSNSSVKISRMELAEELGRRFIKAVRLQSGGNRRIGVTLSGGLDSRTIVAAASRLGINLHTFTWGKNSSYDRLLAGQVARLYKTEHHDSDYLFKNLESGYDAGIRATEGHVNYFDCHMLAHIGIMGEHADVILNGYAGDLVLGGSYLRPAWLKAMPVEKLADTLFKWRNINWPESTLYKVISCFDEIREEQKTSHYYRELISRKKGMHSYDIVESFFLENRVRRQCSMGTVLMRYMVESAAPFFEYDMLDLITSIPAALRHEHKIYLSMNRKVFPESLSVRWQRTLLPASFPRWMNLPAKAFLKGCRILEDRAGWPVIASRQSPVDFAVWLRGPMKSWLENIIYDNNPVAGEILKPDFCRDIFKNHMNGMDFTRLLGVIISIYGFGYALKRARDKSAAGKNQPVEIKI
jgi:asparagine synthase (glutamine-hydrolysing)